MSDTASTALDAYPTECLMNTAARPPLVFVRGDGSWIWDHEGRRYLDFVQGWAVNALGHSPRVLREALETQAARLFTSGPGFFNEPSLRLARLLTEHSPFDRVFFTSSGAEANEGAIKLARKWGTLHKGGAFEIVTFRNAFHGRTLATMSASGKAQFEALFEPKVPGFPKATLNDLGSVEALVTDRTVGVMVEPIQGEAGVLPADDGFLRDLRALTRARGLLLIVDEIQTGMGRTGRLWGHEHAGIEPDIMTLGKMLGSGVPLAALLATDAVACFEHGDQGGTLTGNPLMTAVGHAALSTILAPGFLDDVRARGADLRTALEEVSRTHDLGEVRGRGLLLALDLGREIARDVVVRARAAGLLLNTPRPSTLRLLPPLTVSRGEIDLMARTLDAVIAEMPA